jgi:capsular exopolysaccharide synthesis family protein
MSKIFDALKKADRLRDSGVVEPAMDDILPIQEHFPEHFPEHFSAESVTAVLDAEEPHVAAQTNATAEVEADVQQKKPARVLPLHISAISPVFPFEDLHSQAAEQYRIIRTKIMHHPWQPRAVVVTSATSGDGKTVTAINLAAVLALKQEFRILLVDADLRRRDVSKVLGIPEKPGLANVLKGECTLDDAIVELEQFPNMWILPAGDTGSNPAELLASPRWREVVLESKHHFSYIIIDATPMAAVADFELVQVACDGIVFVVRPDHTDRKTCMRALEAISKDRLIGTVLNCVEEWFLHKTHNYGYYKPY